MCVPRFYGNPSNIYWDISLETHKYQPYGDKGSPKSVGLATINFNPSNSFQDISVKTEVVVGPTDRPARRQTDHQTNIEEFGCFYIKYDATEVIELLFFKTSQQLMLIMLVIKYDI